MTGDILVTDQGSVVLLTPVTPAAREWFDDNVESEGWQWLGGSLGVEHRLADALLDGAVGDGLEVAW